MPPPELTPAPPADEGAPLVLMLTPERLTLVGPAATPEADAAQGASALRAAQNFAGQQRAVALDFDIDIVFEREGDDIACSEIKIAVAN